MYIYIYICIDLFAVRSTEASPRDTSGVPRFHPFQIFSWHPSQDKAPVVYSSALLVRSCLGKGAASQQVASLSWYISGLGGLFMFVVYTKTVPWSFNISKVGNGDSSSFDHDTVVCCPCRNHLMSPRV